MDTNQPVADDGPLPGKEQHPFNEISILFPLLTFYTVAYLGLMVADFILRDAFKLPVGMMQIYIALTAAYAADKEIRRWVGTPEPARKGSVFVYLWLLAYLVAFMFYSFHPEFVMPEEFGKVVLQVLGIFFGSKASRYVFDMRDKKVADSELPERGTQVLALLQKRGKITNREVSDALHISTASAKRILSDLASQGQIQSMGEGRGTHYVLVQQEKTVTRL